MNRGKRAGRANAEGVEARPPRALFDRIMFNAGIVSPSASEFGELRLTASTDGDKLAEARARLTELLETPYGLEVMQELLRYAEPAGDAPTTDPKHSKPDPLKLRRRFVQPREREFGELRLRALAPAEKVQEARERFTTIIGSTYGLRAMKAIADDAKLRPRLLRRFSGPKPERGRLAEWHVSFSMHALNASGEGESAHVSEHDVLVAVARNEKLDFAPLAQTAPARGRRSATQHPVVPELADAVVEGGRPPGANGPLGDPGTQAEDAARAREWARHRIASGLVPKISVPTLTKQVVAEVADIWKRREVLNPDRVPKHYRQRAKRERRHPPKK